MLPQVVAIEKVYEETTTLHNIPLSPDVVKVTVERVRVPDARVPLPSDEVTTVVDAFQTFVASQTPHSNYARTSDNNFISLY